jgi:serine/threonine protein kinase
MVHRDIKPGNLLLDRTGVIKVLDMGLARFFNKQQDSVTEKYDHNCVLGTADYLAPEQAVSNVVDIRADIYALGGTFYFMLAGQTPFPDGTIAAKLVAHQTCEPKPIDSFRSDVPPGMIAVLRRMMEKDPSARFQEPIEVAQALAEWADMPISPPPPREMPVHCPLVQALAGPTAPVSGVPLARALFGPGRGVFSRSGLGSSSGSGSGAHLPLSGSPSTVTFGTGTGSSPSYGTGTASPGPVSTARASVSPTIPIPARSDSAAELPNRVPELTSQHRMGLYIIIAVLLALLFTVGAIAAYYAGRADAGKSAGARPEASESFLSPYVAGDKFRPNIIWTREIAPAVGGRTLYFPELTSRDTRLRFGPSPHSGEGTDAGACQFQRIPRTCVEERGS